MISRSTIERVFESARVEEVVGEFVQLKKAGSNFKGLSPFTDEKSPSFMVSPVKQIWKDFSTGKGGNAISFLMEHEHYTYPEAIKWLANKYNIEIEETEQTNQEKELVNERESMFVVSDFAKEFFHNTMLKTNQGKAIGLSYFKERGFKDETIEKFDLGYCLDEWDHFTNAAIAKGYQLKYLESTGLSIVKENKQFDRFKGRVMFPIHSMSGRTLGFGGRILTNDKKAAKYLNSPESDIYHKGKVLYGIFQAKKEIAKQDNCFLVEGYTDVISFHQSGIENVVASSGTALTPDQIRLISRLTKNITVLFDGDAAGIRASIRGIDLILEQGMNVKVVQFPNGEDPDSFAKSHSDSELQAFLETAAQDFINFKVSLLLEDTQNDPVKKAGLIRDIVASISKIPDAIQREVYVQECARIMEISERILFSELAQLLSKNNTEEAKKYQAEKKTFEVVKRQDVQINEINELEKYEREILKNLILHGNKEVEFSDEIIHIDENGKEIKTIKKYINTVSREIFLQLQGDEIEFTNLVFREIYNELIYPLNQSEKLETNKLINHINPIISSTVTSIQFEEDEHPLSDWERKNIFIKDVDIEKSVNDVIYNLRRILIQKLVKEKSIKEKEYSNDEIEEIMNYNSLRIRLSEKLNRVV